MTLDARTHLFLEGEKCNEINSVVARAKMRVLKCITTITVVFECDARINAKTVMASNECAMYS